jgi:hypothetical protein
LEKYPQKLFHFSDFFVILKNGKSFATFGSFFELLVIKIPAPREAVSR